MSDPGFSCVYMVHTRAARNSHSGNLWVPSNWRNYAVEEISRQSSLKNFQRSAKPHTVRSHGCLPLEPLRESPSDRVANFAALEKISLGSTPVQANCGYSVNFSLCHSSKRSHGKSTVLPQISSSSLVGNQTSSFPLFAQCATRMRHRDWLYAYFVIGLAVKAPASSMHFR